MRLSDAVSQACITGMISSSRNPRVLLGDWLGHRRGAIISTSTCHRLTKTCSVYKPLPRADPWAAAESPWDRRGLGEAWTAETLPLADPGNSSSESLLPAWSVQACRSRVSESPRLICFQAVPHPACGSKMLLI